MLSISPGNLTFSDVQTRNQRYRGVRPTGPITTGFRRGIKSTCELRSSTRDGSGTIVGGDYTSVAIPDRGTDIHRGRDPLVTSSQGD
jgi:hypothetical protein